MSNNPSDRYFCNPDSVAKVDGYYSASEFLDSMYPPKLKPGTEYVCTGTVDRPTYVFHRSAYRQEPTRHLLPWDYKNLRDIRLGTYNLPDLDIPVSSLANKSITGYEWSVDG